MRVASLVPSATEALFALGLGDQVAAVTHECDHPPAVRSLPHLTRSVIPDGLPAAEIDARVRELTGRGEALYELDEEALAKLEVDLIVTQAVCAVCAVSHEDVRAAATRLPSRPRVISLDPSRLAEVFDDLVPLAEATGVTERGLRLRAELAARVERVRDLVFGAPRPRVVALEWLDPPYVGGHWVPEMVAAAGGTDGLGVAGSPSRTVTWEEVDGARPDLLVAREAAAHAERLAASGASRRVAVDAAATFSRPGPRLADGVELLAHLFHPGRAPAPPGIEFVELRQRPEIS
jgi:iron complex transport system substrate-binding protein